MKEYRLNAVLDFVHDAKRSVSVNEVADGVGMSWNTAQNDLDFLTEKGYILKIGKRFRFNYKKIL